MLNKVKQLFTGMSRAMVMTSLATVVICTFGVYSLENKRKLPGDFDNLDMVIQDAQYQISEYTKAPVLPPLEGTWKEVSAQYKLAGLELVAEVDNLGGSVTSTYDGPLRSWRGFIIGDARAVFAATKKAQSENPVYLLDYSVRDGKTQLYIAVVGI